MKNLLAILAFLAGIGAAFAQPPGTHQSYVSLMRTFEPLDGPPASTAICGGVVVDTKRKLVATAWHCVPNEKALLPNLTINGGGVKLLTHSAEADMALFEVEKLGPATPPKFATPVPGEVISAFAYFDSLLVTPQGPQVDRYFPNMTVQQTVSWEGKVNFVAKASKGEGIRYLDKKAATEYTWIAVNGNPTYGFSGGPMFDKKRRFVGIISGSNGGFTTISASSNVELLLKQLPK